MENVEFDEQIKQAFISNGHLSWLMSLYKQYSKTTDKPEFADFMAWLSSPLT